MKDIRSWLGYNFERHGWSDTRENHSDAFDKFIRDLRSKLKAEAQPLGLEVLPFKANWFITSGFVKSIATGKYAYWSISDVRYFRDDWYYNVLYRAAENERDFSGHGGSNRYCNLDELIINIAKLIGDYHEENIDTL